MEKWLIIERIVALNAEIWELMQKEIIPSKKTWIATYFDPNIDPLQVERDLLIFECEIKSLNIDPEEMF